MMVSAFENWVLAKFILSIIGITILLAWICWRVGSLQVLRMRIWTFLNGRSQSSNQTLRTFYEDRTEYVRFRWMTGIPIRNVKQAEALAAWCIHNGENIETIRACGGYFNYEQPGLKTLLTSQATRRAANTKGFRPLGHWVWRCRRRIWRCFRKPIRGTWRALRSIVRLNRRRLPGWRTRWTLALLTAVFLIGAVFTLGTIAIPGAMVQFKHGSSQWLLLQPDRVSLLWSPSISFTPVDCARDPYWIMAATHLDMKEVHMTCGWFGDPARIAYISHTVKTQRIALTVLLLLEIWLSAMLLQGVRAVGAATGMSKRLGGSRSDGCLSCASTCVPPTVT